MYISAGTLPLISGIESVVYCAAEGGSLNLESVEKNPPFSLTAH